MDFAVVPVKCIMKVAEGYSLGPTAISSAIEARNEALVGAYVLLRRTGNASSRSKAGTDSGKAAGSLAVRADSVLLGFLDVGTSANFLFLER